MASGKGVSNENSRTSDYKDCIPIPHNTYKEKDFVFEIKEVKTLGIWYSLHWTEVDKTDRVRASETMGDEKTTRGVWTENLIPRFPIMRETFWEVVWNYFNICQGQIIHLALCLSKKPFYQNKAESINYGPDSLPTETQRNGTTKGKISYKTALY